MEFIKEINIATGETKEIAIDTNEIKKREQEGSIIAAKKATEQAEAEAKANARAAILDRLGLTEEEAALLLS